MHTNNPSKKPAGDCNPAAGQHTNKAEVNPRLPTMTSDWHRVGYGYSCYFCINGGNIQATWKPSVPPARKLRRILEAGKYFAARHAFMLEVSARIGGAVVCLDL